MAIFRGQFAFRVILQEQISLRVLFRGNVFPEVSFIGGSRVEECENMH